MKRFALCFVLGFAAAAYAQTPVIGAGGILNGASFRFSSVPGGGVAPGTLISIFGTNLATAVTAASSVPLTTSLNGTSVTIAGIAAPLFFVSAGQVNAQVPWATPSGSQAVVVTLNGKQSAAVNVAVQSASPGIFTQTSNGRGPGAIQNFVAQGNTPLNNTKTSIAPGGIIIIYATGLGPVASPPADGAAGAGQTTTNAVTLKIGTSTVTPAFAGLAPGFVGLYQVNATVPATQLQGCTLPVQLSVAGQVSNTATVSISSAANCTTLAGDFSASPNSNYGQVNLVRGSLSFNGFPQTYNTIGPAFLKFGPVASAPFIAPPAGGGCIVDFFQNSSGNSTFPNFAGAVTGILDAGTITYTAPNVGSFALTNGPNGYAQATLSSVPAGAHTITSNGGKDIGAMNLTYNVPAQFNGKTDVTGSTISRANGFTGSWNSCPDNAGTVIVGAFSLDTANAVQGTVYCSVSCSAGSFKIGSDLLGQLPLGTSGGAGAFTAFIGVPGKITATGLDAAYFTFLDFISLESLTMVP